MRTIIFALLAVLILGSCKRVTEPSPKFEKAHPGCKTSGTCVPK